MDALLLSPGGAPTLVPLLRRSLSWVMALAMALFLSACGGGGGSDPTPPAGTGTSAPTITTQPASQSVTAPAAATFSVVATGSPTYQWQVSTNAGATFSDIAGETSASFTTAATAVGDTGRQFRVVMSNSAGSVTSSAATLTVTTSGATTLAGYPYAITIDASNTLWVSVLPNIYASSPSFGGLIQSVSLSGNVSTLAGSATPGFVNGTGTAARFNGPMGIARDSAGDIYVADALNNTLRKVSSAGAVSTFAGSPSSGFVDGSGTAARFSSLRGVAVDSSGNAYVADRGNNAIRKVTPAGVVSTLAGSSLPGSTDGTGSAASFFNPEGIAVDAAGIVYVADTSNSIIRRITPAGVVTTFAGPAADLTDPRGLAVDASGNVYVADTAHHRIRRITPAGVVTTLAGSGTSGSADGTGTAASFFSPMGVAVDASGNVFVADTGNHAIRMITPGGVVTTLVN